MIELAGSFLVCSGDVDADGLLAPEAFQEKLQILSDHHSDQLGCGWDEMRKIAKTWVISRIRVQFFRRPALGEKIQISTWPTPATASGVDRNYRLFDADSIPIAMAMAKWSVIDFLTKRPFSVLKLPLMKRDLDYSKEKVFSDGYGWLEDENEEDGRIFERQILPFDIDANGHVNNTRYVAFCRELLTESISNYRFGSEYRIHYLSPIFDGEILRMSIHSENRTFAIRAFVFRGEKITQIFWAQLS